MATNPLFIDAVAGAPSYNGLSYRLGLSALLAGPSAGQIFSGVRGGNVTVVGTAITIAPLTYAVNGLNSPGAEGFYVGSFQTGDADLSKTLTAAHATLDRIDRILVHVYNNALDASTFNKGAIEYQVGTPASSPVAPTLPTGSVAEIALISVPHSGGGSPSVTMTAKPPVAAGGGRPGTVSGDFEVYNVATSSWVRIAQSVGAHFQGGYDPGVASAITNNTWTSMPITNTVTNSRVTLVGGNSLRIDEAGLYQCNGSVRLNTGTASGTGRSRFSVNGTEKRQYNSPLTANSLVLPVSCQLRLAVNDVLRFEVQQDQGSNRNFSNGEIWNYIDIARVS